MELFSEIYGIYYDIVKRILEKECMTEKEIYAMAKKYGFDESPLQMMPKLLDNTSWRLLEKEAPFYKSKLKNKPSMPLTLLEKQFLKAMILDKKCRLFLQQEDIDRLKTLLKEVEPLFLKETVCFFDQFQNGDDFDDMFYQQKFRCIHKAMRTKRVVFIKYFGAKRKKQSRLHKGYFLPLKWEYSQKDDKFRLYCAKLEQSGKTNIMLLNMARIVLVKETEKNGNDTIEIQKMLNNRKVKKPVVIEITSERNAIERFLVEFSPYEKESEYDDETNVCTVRMWYEKNDETEILIKLLGFGPVLKVVSPPSFVKQMKQRVTKQMKLLSFQNPYGIREQ